MKARVPLSRQLGWGAQAGLDKFTPTALGSKAHKSQASAGLGLSYSALINEFCFTKKALPMLLIAFLTVMQVGKEAKQYNSK